MNFSYVNRRYHIWVRFSTQVIFWTRVILWTKTCLVLVFFLPVSALYFRRKCHQEVSLLSFNAWHQGCCLFNISFAWLPKAHMHQRSLGVKAIVLVCGFVAVFSGRFYIILVFEGRCNFFQWVYLCACEHWGFTCFCTYFLESGLFCVNLFYRNGALSVFHASFLISPVLD